MLGIAIAVFVIGLCSLAISSMVIKLQEKWRSAANQDELEANKLRDTYNKKYTWSDFESDTLKLLRQKSILTNTKKSTRLYVNGKWFGDFGGDILAEMGTLSCVVQCKLHSAPEQEGLSDEAWSAMLLEDEVKWTKTSIRAVHDVFLARHFYKAACAMIVTNTLFTEPARVVASDLGVVLVDKDVLDGIYNDDNTAISERIKFLKSSTSRPRWLTEFLYMMMKRRVTFSKYQRKYSSEQCSN